MNLNESIISSFFFHLILFLLVIAAVNFTAGFPGGTGKILPVELTIEKSDDQPSFHIKSEAEPLQDLNQILDEKMNMPDQNKNNPPKEQETLPEPENKAEARAESVLPQPIRTEGFTSPEAYHQFIMLHKKIFSKQAGGRVNELIGEALRVNKGQFYGGTAIVNLKFGTGGKLNEVHVDTASPDLKAFLDEINWVAVPSPAAYSLGYVVVRIEFTIHEGYMSFTISTL